MGGIRRKVSACGRPAHVLGTLVGIALLLGALWPWTPARGDDTTSPPTRPAPAAAPKRKHYFDSREHVQVTAVPTQSAVAPGADLPVAIVFDIDPGWHIQTNDPVIPPELGKSTDYIKAVLVPQAPPAPVPPTPTATAPGGASTPTDGAASAGHASGQWGALVPHADFMKWPAPTFAEVKFTAKAVRYGVFSGKSIVYLPVTVPDDAKPGPATLTILATFQACNEVSCLGPVYDEPIELNVRIAAPGEQTSGTMPGATPNADLFKDFPVGVWGKVHAAGTPGTPGTPETPGTPSDKSPIPNPQSQIPSPVVFSFFRWSFTIDPSHGAGFALLLGVAALGGLLLNFTPCVLPVIPLKILGLKNSAGSRARCLALGTAMSLGVVAFWMALALLIGVAHVFTSTFGLFEYPAVGIGVGVIIAVMALAMCGLFYIRLPQSVYQYSPKQDSYAGSFAFGIMTAVLSTPCTAPGMGVAAAWALGQPAPIICATFAAIGLGMALPYFLLAAFPALVARLPRSGPGSELLKQVMGLLMLAAAAYFIGTGIVNLRHNPITEPSRLYWWAVAAFVVAGGAWLAYRSVRILRSPVRRTVFAVLGAGIVVIGVVGGFHLTAPGPMEWVYFTPDRLADARKSGRVVVLDFTATWCINCKVLESQVLDTSDVVNAFRQDRVVPMRIYVGSSPAADDLLHTVNRVAVPALVVLARDGHETLNSEAYTVAQVVEAVQRAER